jgi:hypothetical protein
MKTAKGEDIFNILHRCSLEQDHQMAQAGLGVHVQLGSSHYSDLYISAVSPPASPALRSEGLCQLLTFKLPDWLQLQDRVTYHIKSVLILWNCIITQI